MSEVCKCETTFTPTPNARRNGTYFCLDCGKDYSDQYTYETIVNESIHNEDGSLSWVMHDFRIGGIRSEQTRAVLTYRLVDY